MTKEKHKLTPQQAEEILAKLMKDSAPMLERVSMKIDAELDKYWKTSLDLSCLPTDTASECWAKHKAQQAQKMEEK
jgi:hypothetical protein